MEYRQTTWFDPRLAGGPSVIHRTGLFASTPIRAGEVVMVWGGTAWSRAQLDAGEVPPCSFSFIDDDLLLAGPEDGLDYFVNHSCDPSVWMADEVTVVSRRDIASGDEITGDYALWESDDAYLVEACTCAITNSEARGVYNITDGRPLSSTTFINMVAKVAGLPAPPQVSMEEAQLTFSPERLSFLNESRRVSNERMLKHLGVTLKYADVEAGIRASMPVAGA